MNLYQVLKALSDLAPQIGLPEGLEGWEMLAQRMQEDKTDVGLNQVNGMKQVEDFVQSIITAVNENHANVDELFDTVSKMSVDPNYPRKFKN